MSRCLQHKYLSDKVTSLVRILHSNASMHTMLLMTSVFAPSLSLLNKGLPQHCKKSLHFNNMKAQHQYATERKKPNKSSYLYSVAKVQNFRACSQALAVPSELAKLNEFQLLITSRPRGKDAAPSLAHPFECC